MASGRTNRAVVLGVLAGGGAFCATTCMCVLPPLFIPVDKDEFVWAYPIAGLVLAVFVGAGFGFIVGRDWYRTGR